jgi:restriction endonuclease S subunit
MSWEEVQLGTIAEVSWGDTTTTKASYTSTGYLAFSATGPDGYLDHYDHEEPGIVLSAIGAQCGKTWYTEGRWSCIKNTIYIIGKSEKVSTRFLYYLLFDPSSWPKRGAAQPFISQTDARHLLVRIPPRPTQEAIVRILSKYDNLIQNNTRRIAVVEEMARRVFEEWFVYFRVSGYESLPKVDSPVGPLPQTWEVAQLGDIAQVQWGDLGKTKKSYAPAGYNAYSATGMDGLLDYYDFDRSGSF